MDKKLSGKWHTRKGAKIALEELTDSHLTNILRLQRKKAELRRLESVDLEHTWRDHVKDSSIFEQLEAEANKRNLLWEDGEIDLSESGTLERRIAGALKSAIQAHGPITVELVESALKRVIGAIKDHNNRRKEQ